MSHLNSHRARFVASFTQEWWTDAIERATRHSSAPTPDIDTESLSASILTAFDRTFMPDPEPVRCSRCKNYIPFRHATYIMVTTYASEPYCNNCAAAIVAERQSRLT